MREGRRKEFAHFPEFADPATREQIPDPNAPETFAASIPKPDPAHGEPRRELYQHLIAIRAREIAPYLEQTRSIDARPLGSAAAVARWRLGDAGY